MTDREIFIAAAQIESLAERAAFLDQVCGGDVVLRQNVDELLAAQHKLGSFLEASPAAVATIEREPPGSERLGTQIGPYKLLQKLGEGGMGAVYLAEQQQPVKRQVALKIIKAGMDSAQVVARFEQERQALAIMDHPNIAKVLDAGTTESGRLFFVMELVKGIPITRYCDQEHLSPKERLELFIPVCQAVQHAHQKGIIHRDLKPSNVLIALYDGKPVPKVIDFGVAKATNQKLTERTLFTEVGSIVGTLEYMAPEQAELNNLDIDTRADIYSLGVLLYELLTGATPFSGRQLRSAGFNEMLRIIKEVEPPKPSTKLSSSAELPSIAANRKLEPARLTKLVRGDLDWIVMKCLEKERARRYETANAFALDIQRYIHDEAVLAGPPSTVYRLKKFLCRNKGPALAAAGLLVALLAGVVGTTWGYVRAERSRQREAARAETEAQQRRRAETAEATAKASERLAASERDRAEQEVHIAQAVKDFLQNRLLGQADPENQVKDQVGSGDLDYEIKPNPTIRELLDRAAAGLTPEKIEAQFPGMPLVQGEILRTIGQTYWNIGERADATIELFERSRKLFVEHRGKDHPETFATENMLALAYMKNGKYAVASGMLEQVRDRQIAVLGKDHPDTLTTLHNLAWAYKDERRTEESIALFKQVLAKRIAILGPDHMETMRTVHELGWAYYDAKQYANSIQIFEGSLRLRSARLGPQHPQTLWSMNGLANCYRRTGRITEAIKLYEQLLDGRRATLGPQHAFSLGTMYSLARAYREAKRWTDMIRIQQETRDLVVAKHGKDHSEAANADYELAWAYWYSGKPAEAGKIFQSLIERQARELGTDDPKVLNSTNGLAWSYQRLGKTKEAIQLFEEVRSGLTAAGGHLGSTLNGLWQAYYDAKRWKEAAEVLEQYYSLNKAEYGAQHANTIYVLQRLGTVYMNQGKLEEGRQRYEEVLKIRRQTAEPDSLDVAEVLNTLGLVLLRQKKPYEAEVMLRENLAIREKTQPDSWTTFFANSVLGQALYGQQKFAEAEPLLVAGFEGMKQREDQIHVSFRRARLTESLKRLIDLYTAWDKPEEANKWRKILDEHKPAETPAADTTEKP